MADNFELNAGTGGVTLAADDVAGVWYQIIKLALGAADSATLVDGNSGNKSAGTIRVVIATDQPALTNKLLVTPDLPSGASTSAKQDTIIGHVDGIEGLLTTIDGDTGALAAAVSGSEMQVDVITLPAIPAGNNNIGDVDIASIAAGDNNIGNVDIASIAAGDNNIGNVDVVTLPALPAGNNNIGDVDVASIAAGTNAIGNVGVIPRTSGGMTIFRSLDIDETEEEIKATAGQVFSITAFNTTAAPLYLKFYNATAANVTVGTTTPVLTFMVPGNGDSDGAGFVWNNEIGFAFGTAITVACTTAIADNDTGAPGANACLINVGYA